MNTTAAGTFEIDAWDDEKPYDERGDRKLTKVRVRKTFHGDLVGTSVTDLITVETASGPAAYVGVETVEGILHGREGSFVLQHSAGSDESGQWLRWLIVPTSGTGELAGIRGEGRITARPDGSHAWNLDYTLA